MVRSETPATVGAAIRHHRLLSGVTLRELAARIEVSPATVSAIENGRTGVSVERLTRVAAALELPAATLLSGTGTGRPRDAQPAPLVPAVPTVDRPTDHWRDFAPLPIDGVLAGAVRAFVATGYHGANMRSIAAQAHMSVPGVYHHYASKQDLLVRVFDLTMGDLIWRVEQARDESGDPVERVALVVEALALYHARRNDLAFIGASEMRSLEPADYRRIAELRNHVQHLLDGTIAAALAAGALRVDHARDAGKAIATMCTSLAQWFHPDGPTTPEQIADEYAQLALRMLGARTTTQT